MEVLYRTKITADDGKTYLLCHYLLRREGFYGVRVEMRCQEEVVEAAQITYLGEANEGTLGLIHKLGRNTVTPCVLAEVADEWLEMFI